MAQADSKQILISQNTRERKSSIYDEEEIEIHPSTELIPDEYIHKPNEKVLFHIFAEETFVLDLLIKGMQDTHSNTDQEKYVHTLESPTKLESDVTNALLDVENKSGLFMLFITFYEKDGNICFKNLEQDRHYEFKKIWNKLSTKSCEPFLNKPKVVMFLTVNIGSLSRKIQSDMSVRSVSSAPAHAYDFPTGSDILILHKKFLSPKNLQNFIDTFGKKVDEFKAKYDIIDIFNFAQDEQGFPICISTLTRKFYLVSNEQREMFLAITESNNKLKHDLEKLYEYVESLHEKKKKKPFLSFRKQNDEKSKTQRSLPNTIRRASVLSDTTDATEKTSKQKKPWRF